VFEEEDLVDLDDDLRASFRERAIPQPVRVATDRQALTDPRCYDLPVIVIACEFPSATLREWMEQGHPYTAELKDRLSRTRRLSYRYWPQFSRPAELAGVILLAVEC
jgi:hypothetical protein